MTVRRRCPPLGHGLYADLNSLCNSRMWLKEWRAQQFRDLYTPTTARFVDNQEGECALVNGASDSPQYGTIYSHFVCPEGVTSVRLEMRIKLPPSAVAQPIRCGIYNPSFTDFVNSAVMVETPSESWTTYTLVYTGLVPGQRYYPIGNFNYPGGQAPTLVKFIRVVPLDGTGMFATDFWRLTLDPGVALFDGQPEVFYRPGVENTHCASAGTRYAIQTDATDFQVEIVTDNTLYPEYNGVGLVVNNTFSSLLALTPYTSFTLASGVKRVELEVMPLWKLPVEGSNTWPVALFVGVCTMLCMPRFAFSSAPKVLVLGDSVTCGFFAGPGLGYWDLLINAGYISAILRAVAGLALFDVASTPEARAAYVALFADVDFDHVYFDLAANDAYSNAWGGGAEGVAAFKAALEDLVDRFHVAYPACGCYIQSPFVWDPAIDAVQDPYRVAMAEVAVGRGWVTFIDGTTLVSNAYLKPGDQFHFTTEGHAVIAASLIVAMGLSLPP